MNIAPNCAVSRLKGKSVVITHYDVYEDLSQILQAPHGSTTERLYRSHLDQIHNQKTNLLPSSVRVPTCIRQHNIPISSKDSFFDEVASSVLSTIAKVSNNKDSTHNELTNYTLHETDDDYSL